MMPHEQLLVRRFQSKPFALLGITTDADPSVAQGYLRQKSFTWRNGWDHGMAISQRWDVEYLPTIYLIDHRGVIRFARVGTVPPAELEAAIERLVQEAKGGAS